MFRSFVTVAQLKRCFVSFKIVLTTKSEITEATSTQATKTKTTATEASGKSALGFQNVFISKWLSVKRH